MIVLSPVVDTLISVPNKQAIQLAEKFLEDPLVLLAGLGARDSLRLEAGLCLYGNDIDATTTPIEAALNWTIGKRRRIEGEFLGSEVILKQLKEGVSRKRVGLTFQGTIARDHAKLYENENPVGEVSSGTFSPSLKQAIGMGYVPTKLSKIGTPLQVLVRDKYHPAAVAKLPFIKPGYYKAA